jgi:hypothetical protein
MFSTFSCNDLCHRGIEHGMADSLFVWSPKSCPVKERLLFRAGFLFRSPFKRSPVAHFRKMNISLQERQVDKYWFHVNHASWRLGAHVSLSISILLSTTEINYGFPYSRTLRNSKWSNFISQSSLGLWLQRESMEHTRYLLFIPPPLAEKAACTLNHQQN